MIYVISDIHGCYDEYRELLKKINFSADDELFVLGDVVDRGPEPIKVLQDMMMRPNVYPILGNHDYITLKILKKLCVEINEENAENYLCEEDMMDYLYWLNDGGKSTIDAFRKLDKDEQNDILEYLEEFTLYEEVYVNNKRFILVHAGLHNFVDVSDSMEDELDLDVLHFTDFILYQTDYSKRCFNNKNTFLVSGHTPTFTVREDGQALVYEKNGHIAIDCGCVFGRRLAAYCLNDGSCVYVDKK